MMEKQKQELPIADKKMLVGIKDSIECPICNKASDYMPEKQGLTKFKCSKCQGFFLAKVEPQVTTQVKRGKPTQGRISIMRRWWFPKDFPLHNGVNTIGRADDEIVSDIAIENDDSISRRSIAIEVSMPPPQQVLSFCFEGFWCRFCMLFRYRPLRGRQF